MYSHDAEKNEGYEAEGDATKAAPLRGTARACPYNSLSLRASAGRTVIASRRAHSCSWPHQYGVIRQNGPGGVVSYTLTYDDNGSLTGDGTWSYAYDVENRLTCAQENGAAPVSWTLGACVFGASSSKRAVYGYDPIGRRFRKCVVLAPGSGDPCADVTNGIITEFTSDGVEEVQDVDGLTNAVLIEYIHGPGIDEIAFYADRVNGGSFYPTTDHLGSVVALQQKNVSSMAEAFHYTAYGEIAAGEESGYPFRFTGRRYDAETGLYYYRARYYNPILGRFYQTDPIGYGDNMNMYAYVGNDPVNGRDPSGEFVVQLLAGVLGAASAIAAEVVTSAITGQSVSVSSLTAAGAGGFVGGVTLATTGSLVAANFAAGATQNFVSQGLEKGFSNVNGSEVLVAGGASAVAGKIAGDAFGALGKATGLTGRGSPTQVARQITTKALNGDISRVSASTAGKIGIVGAAGVAGNSSANLITEGAAGIVQNTPIMGSGMPRKPVIQDPPVLCEPECAS